MDAGLVELLARGGTCRTPTELALSLCLDLKCALNRGARVFVARWGCRTLKAFSGDRTHFGKQVESIEQGARSAPCVATLCSRSANACACRVACEAARAWIACGDEQYISREAGAFIAAFDPYLLFFEGLPKPFEGGALKLGEFVKKQHSAVSAREFARTQGPSTAKERLRRNTVVRSSKGGLLRQALHRAMQ